jgi:PAS domain S-box-containing protein
MNKWIRQSLSRKLVFVLSGGTILVSTLFLFLFLGLYRAQLQNELSDASSRVNELLQASLENAMLKRDIPGLSGIVQRLGEVEGIDHVMILNPKGEVRFTSDPAMLGRVFDMDSDEICRNCLVPGEAGESTEFMKNEQGREVLRSVNPVQNKEPCQVCHGAISDNPINGILFVDYSAASLKQQSTVISFLFLLAGFLVLLLLATIVWWGQRRFVLRPIAKLTAATGNISNGHLDERVNLQGEDELAGLGQSFDVMAAALEKNVRALEENERYLQALINSVPDGVLVIDKDFRILNANDAYCRMTGYSLDGVVGNHCHHCSHNRDMPCPPTMETCPVVELSDEKQEIKCIQTFSTKDGDDCLVEITASSFNIEIDGKVQRLIVESIRNMAEIMRFSQEQRLSGLGLLASGVAHEIYNPLASIRLAIQSSIRKIRMNVGKQHDLLSDMELVDKEIDRCVSITERLLKLSKHPDAVLQPIDAHVALIETVSLVGYEGDSVGIDLVINPHASDSMILADDSDLRMLILNLVQNAFHAMPRGGKLNISTDNQNEMFNLYFKDDGVGIRESDMARIFDPFFSHRADSDEGTGLGLSICLSITERFGGTIEAINNPDKGACFHVSLPLAAGQLES